MGKINLPYLYGQTRFCEMRTRKPQTFGPLPKRRAKPSLSFNMEVAV